jgi:hypothetical protein
VRYHTDFVYEMRELYWIEVCVCFSTLAQPLKDPGNGCIFDRAEGVCVVVLCGGVTGCEWWGGFEGPRKGSGGLLPLDVRQLFKNWIKRWNLCKLKCEIGASWGEPCKNIYRYSPVLIIV